MSLVSNQVVNLGVEVGERIQESKRTRQINDLSLRVYLLENLVKFLDPEHVYIWSDEYGAFIKEPRK